MATSFYKWGARFYDPFWRNFTAKTLERLLSILDFKRLSNQEQPACLLDIGCGTGELEMRLVRLAPELKIKIIGLDSSEEMLTQAKNKLFGSHEVTFVLGDVNLPLPFRDAMFDVVVSANALHYVIQPEKLLGEIKRILKPDGQLVIEDFTVHGQFFWPVFELIVRLFDPQLYKTYTLTELSQFVKALGLTTTDSGNFKIDWWWHGMFVRATPTE